MGWPLARCLQPVAVLTVMPQGGEQICEPVVLLRTFCCLVGVQRAGVTLGSLLIAAVQYAEPVKLVYQEPQRSQSLALKREAAIKRLTRRQKLALIGTGKRSPG